MNASSCSAWALTSVGHLMASPARMMRTFRIGGNGARMVPPTLWGSTAPVAVFR